ncbi:MAG: hypothetical protein K8R58_10320 [Bacteroidales bacterium]|nr:hypothetical protein [Bacteroidales bacterium]
MKHYILLIMVLHFTLFINGQNKIEMVKMNNLRHRIITCEFTTFVDGIKMSQRRFVELNLDKNKIRKNRFYSEKKSITKFGYNNCREIKTKYSIVYQGKVYKTKKEKKNIALEINKNKCLFFVKDTRLVLNETNSKLILKNDIIFVEKTDNISDIIEYSINMLEKNDSIYYTLTIFNKSIDTISFNKFSKKIHFVNSLYCDLFSISYPQIKSNSKNLHLKQILPKHKKMLIFPISLKKEIKHILSSVAFFWFDYLTFSKIKNSNKLNNIYVQGGYVEISP